MITSSEPSEHREPMVERTAGRAIVLRPPGEVLMIRGLDPNDVDRGEFWWTPGGGLDDGESWIEGTRREVWEEIGLDAIDLDGPVLERVGEFDFGGRRLRQTEQYFVIRAPADFAESTPNWSALEREAIRELRWLSTAALRELSEPFYPWCLADLIDHIERAGLPHPPWSEEQRFDPS